MCHVVTRVFNDLSDPPRPHRPNAAGHRALYIWKTPAAHVISRAVDRTLQLEILPQPNDSTCGPTCLHAVYRYYGETLSLDQIIAETRELETGGTLAVFLASHALRRGYNATIYTYNLGVFDPTWFTRPDINLAERLKKQAKHKNDTKLEHATQGYLEFLRLGGKIEFVDLGPELIRRYLKKGIPILTGLSSTYLYQAARESGTNVTQDDDVRGEPAGHFVVLCGYKKEPRTVMVADPYLKNPLAPGQYYETGIHRLIGAILLGVLTHDANLLIIQPKKNV